MKRKSLYILFILLFAVGKTAFSQQPFLTINYFYSEKSRDSHSTTENISLTGSTVMYSVKYSGRKGPTQIDKNSECTISPDQLSKIRKTIEDKKLNVTDSLVDNSVPEHSPQVMVSITVTVSNGSKPAKIKIKGDPSVLGARPLYKSTVSLFNQVKGMLGNCH